MLTTWTCKLLLFIFPWKNDIKNPGVGHFGMSSNLLWRLPLLIISPVFHLFVLFCVIIFSILSAFAQWFSSWQDLNHFRLMFLLLVSFVLLSTSDRDIPAFNPHHPPKKKDPWVAFCETTVEMWAVYIYFNGYGFCDLWKCRQTSLIFTDLVNYLS